MTLRFLASQYRTRISEDYCLILNGHLIHFCSVVVKRMAVDNNEAIQRACESFIWSCFLYFFIQLWFLILPFADQRHVETNIQASLGEISVILSFLPEEREHSQNSPCSLNHMNDSHGIGCGSLSTSDMVDSPENVPSADSFMSCLSTMNVDQSSIMEINGANPDVHHLDARFQNITLKLQVSCFENSISDL